MDKTEQNRWLDSIQSLFIMSQRNILLHSIKINVQGVLVIARLYVNLTGSR